MSGTDRARVAAQIAAAIDHSPMPITSGDVADCGGVSTFTVISGDGQRYVVTVQAAP